MAHEPDSRTTGAESASNDGRWRTSLVVPFVIVVLVIGIIGAIVIVTRQDQSQGEAALAGASIQPITSPITVPYREVAGAIVIDATFGDDSRTVPMILDTGAPTIVSEELADVFAAGSAGTIATSSVDGQTTTSAVVRLPELSIGGARFDDVAAVVGAIEPGDPFYCISESGFIGTSLLRTAVWRIDPRTREITIATDMDQLASADRSPAYQPPDTGSAIRLDFERASAISPSPVISLGSANGELAYLVDTGSDGWLASHPDDARRAGAITIDEPPTRVVLANGGGGPFTARMHWTSAPVALGSETQQLPIATSDVLPTGLGNMGTDFLRHFVITIDWPNDALYLEPIDLDPSPSIPMSVTLGWDGGFVVGSLVEGRDDTKGLELGAGVSAVDGEDVVEAPFDDYCRRFREGSDPSQMTVADGPGSVTIPVGPVEDFFGPLDT